mmetsp:Transcript_12813/g.22007  ORF Transcript_12813/g.22007 Transcript_12813/m.22007 type:complete len:268 (-) Transcript_12813:855-1658(-)
MTTVNTQAAVARTACSVAAAAVAAITAVTTITATGVATATATMAQTAVTVVEVTAVAITTTIITTTATTTTTTTTITITNKGVADQAVNAIRALKRELMTRSMPTKTWTMMKRKKVIWTMTVTMMLMTRTKATATGVAVAIELTRRRKRVKESRVSQTQKLISSAKIWPTVCTAPTSKSSVRASLNAKYANARSRGKTLSCGISLAYTRIFETFNVQDVINPSKAGTASSITLRLEAVSRAKLIQSTLHNFLTALFRCRRGAQTCQS